MLVVRVIGDCPGCGGKQQFGNVSVKSDYILRGCKSCKYRENIQLPIVKKKIIYLDQFFFSHAFREREKKFVEAAELISHIAGLQLLAAPFSSIHEDETHQWRGYGDKNKDDLMEFIKSTSRGHEFKPNYEIERTQIVRAFIAFCSNSASHFQLQEGDALDADIHEWDDYFRIDIRRYYGDIDLIRDLKGQTTEGLVDLFPEWRKSTNSFEQDIDAELQTAGQNYLDAYIKFVQRIGRGDYAALLDAPIASTVVQTLLYLLPSDQGPELSLKTVIDFFNSQHFKAIPYQYLSATLFAELKRMVKNGSYQNRDVALQRMSGFFQDVNHIATYAPYCDAFVMDQAMASMVSTPGVNLEQGCDVKVFSLNNWKELLDWLTGLENDMSAEHQTAVAEAYP